MSKRGMPFLMFYPADWLADAVQGCSPAAKGVWIDMLCVMHGSERYGYLESEGKPIPDEFMFRRCGCSTVEEYRNLLAELFSAGVPSRTPEGVIYNRRMVRDQQSRQSATERQRKHRACHAPVTPMSQEEVISHKSEVIKTKEKRKSAARPPADLRYGPFLELSKSSFESKYGHPPTWDCFGKDGAALSAFLRRAPHVTVEVWTAHLSAYFDSTEPFTVKQGGSLSYFVSKFDAFEHGPILEGGSSNGKLVSFAEQRSQKNSAAIQRVLGRAEEALGGIRRALPPDHN